MKINIVEIKKILKQINDSKNIIVKERDKLRAIFDELDALLDSFNQGIDNIENGRNEIEQGLDDLSEYI